MLDAIVDVLRDMFRPTVEKKRKRKWYNEKSHKVDFGGDAVVI